MDLFGDTVLPILVNGNPYKSVKRKPNGELALALAEKFPEGAIEFLGYGAIVEVKWKKRWHRGQVIGKEEGGLMVRYRDGVATHGDLHQIGCRIKVFRRNVDIDAIYERSPWLKCPLLGEEEACACWPCRTVKWPGRYREWGLSNAQIETLESVKAAERGEHYEIFFGEGRLQLAEPNGDGSGDEGGGIAAPDGDEHTERQDGDQADTREQDPPLAEGEKGPGKAAGGCRMGLRSAASGIRGACQQGHAPKRGKHGDAEGQRGGGAGNGTNGEWRTS